MARKRNKTPQKYIIQHGKLQHVTSARRFAVWIRLGLLVAVNSHRAQVSAAAKTIWENGELHLAPIAQPEPSVRTNAQTVDEEYIFAHDGQVRITRDERLRFADWRMRFAELADQMITEYLSRQREFDMRAQYGW
jgi:hypothetical protein